MTACTTCQAARRTLCRRDWQARRRERALRLRDGCRQFPSVCSPPAHRGEAIRLCG